MGEPEPEAETHDDAMELVKTVFEQMGGTVLPPKRPGHIHRYAILHPQRDAFLMDFENAVLRDWDARKGIPKGRRRFENTEWAELIKRNVYPHLSDVDWDEYVQWVEKGGGDECFQEEDACMDTTAGQISTRGLDSTPLNQIL